MFRRTIVSDVVQGIIIGGVLAFITAQIIMITHVTTVNGWTTIFGCGKPGNGMLLRAACTNKLPAVNVPQEAVYCTTSVDGTGQKLSGQYDYILHFPAGGLPPNNAFWSLTIGDAKNRFVPNPINRYSVGDRSGLVPNADGSVDIYIQNAAPAGHESNWLPVPSDKFTLWLRVYIPGAGLERTGVERHDADSLAEQLGARARPRARIQRQRPGDGLRSFETDTTIDIYKSWLSFYSISVMSC